MKTTPLVIGLGEILWDLLPTGRQLGGAPANFAFHAAQLGAEACVVSRIGRDANGEEIRRRLESLALETRFLGVDPSRPTGTVSVALDAAGKPTFTIHEDVAWDFIEAGPPEIDLARRAEIICFGSLAQRSPVSRTAIRQVLAAARPDAWRIFDINLRQHFYSREIIEDTLRLSNVLKLNDGELPVVGKLLGIAGDETSCLQALAATFHLRAITLTKGAAGSAMWMDGRVHARPAEPVRVADSVGAGDAYGAALAMGLLAGRSPAQILEAAHALAGFVCTQPGATPQLPADLAQRLRQRFRQIA